MITPKINKASFLACIAIGFALLGCDRSDSSSSKPADSSRDKERPTQLAVTSEKHKDHAIKAEDEAFSNTMSYPSRERVIRETTDPARRYALLKKIIDLSGQHESQQIEKLIQETTDEPDRSILTHALAQVSSRNNPELYYRVLDNSAKGIGREMLLESGMRQLLPEQMPAFFEHLQKNGEPSDVKTLQFILGRSSAVPIKDKNTYRKVMEVVTDPAMRQTLTFSYAKSLPPGALPDYHSMIDGVGPSEKDAYTQMVYWKTLQQDRTRLGEILLQPGMPPEVMNALIEERVQADSSGSKGEAFREAEKLPEPGSTAYISSMGRRWIEYDSRLASSAITNMAAGKSRDVLAKEVAKYAARSGENDNAQQWISQIADPAVRSQAQREIEEGKGK